MEREGGREKGEGGRRGKRTEGWMSLIGKVMKGGNGREKEKRVRSKVGKDI